MTNKLAMGRKNAKTKQVKHCKDCHDLSREVLQRVFSKGVCNLKKRKNSACVCVCYRVFFQLQQMKTKWVGCCCVCIFHILRTGPSSHKEKLTDVGIRLNN